MVLMVLVGYVHQNIEEDHLHLLILKMLVALEVSITEPPPTAIIASHLFVR